MPVGDHGHLPQPRPDLPQRVLQLAQATASTSAATAPATRPARRCSTRPGVVDIFCNIHQRMSAHVLVVPSKLYTRVRPDGSFRIEGVPAGRASVVAWSPSLKPSSRRSRSARATPPGSAFDMEYTDQKSPHQQAGPALRLVQRISGQEEPDRWSASSDRARRAAARAAPARSGSSAGRRGPAVAAAQDGGDAIDPGRPGGGRRALRRELESLRTRAKVAAGLEPLRAALSDRVDVADPGRSVRHRGLVARRSATSWPRPRLVIGDARGPPRAAWISGPAISGWWRPRASDGVASGVVAVARAGR